MWDWVIDEEKKFNWLTVPLYRKQGSICLPLGRPQGNFSHGRRQSGSRHLTWQGQEWEREGRCYTLYTRTYYCNDNTKEGGVKPLETSPMIQLPTTRPHLQYWELQFDMRFGGHRAKPHQAVRNLKSTQVVWAQGDPQTQGWGWSGRQLRTQQGSATCGVSTLIHPGRSPGRDSLCRGAPVALLCLQGLFGQGPVVHWTVIAVAAWLFRCWAGEWSQPRACSGSSVPLEWVTCSPPPSLWVCACVCANHPTRMY